MAFNLLSPDQGDRQFLDNQTIPRQRFVHSEALDTVTSDWLVIPPGIGDVLVSVEPTSGTARIEYTQAPMSEVDAGTAVGKPWTEGDVSEYTDVVMANAVTAVRMVCTGPSEWRVSV